MINDRSSAWLRTLLPDDVTRKRLTQGIEAKARPLLAARREGWFEAVSEWATILSPVAAAVTLVFAGLALRHAGATPEAPTELAGAPGVVELVQPGQALPSAFEGDSVPDLDVVMTVLYEAEDPR